MAMFESCEPSESATDRPRTGRDATGERCAECGGRVTPDEWHPVVTERDDGDRVEIFDFCCDACRDEWRDESE